MKLIKVKSCKSCPYKKLSLIKGSIYYCKKEVDYILDITLEVDDGNVIHKNCPLEDEK